MDGDGEVVAAVVDQEKQEAAGSEWVGETLTGYEGDSAEAFGRTFTFVKVQRPAGLSDNGYVIVEID